MTVSRVINQKDDVSLETRQRVLKIIQELDYHPSAIARSLATQQTRTIGLVVPDVANPFFADITRGIEHLAYAQGYHVFLCNTEEDPQRELAVIHSLEEKQVDGLILCSSRIEEKPLIDLLARLPAAVLINRHLSISDGSVQTVILDDERSGWLATQYLLQGGRRQIGLLAGPPTSYSGQGRRQGYLAAMDAAGQSPQPEWAVNCLPSVKGGQQAAQHVLTRFPGMEALFCFNDLVAVGALQACAELHRRVPDDLAIVGHDDIPLAALVSPTLTTCQVQRQELGARAVEALIERMRECPSGCQQIVFQPELIIRQSAP